MKYRATFFCLAVICSTTALGQELPEKTKNPDLSLKPDSSATLPFVDMPTTPSQGLPILTLENPRVPTFPSTTPNGGRVPQTPTIGVFGTSLLESNPTEQTPVYPVGSSKEKVSFSYMFEVSVQTVGVNNFGEQVVKSYMQPSNVTAEIEVDCDLSKLEFSGDGKRAAIQAVTAARHIKLLQTLKEAKTDAEKLDAAKKMEENYRSHYASETTWRMKRIADIEQRLEEMRSQVKARESSEDKYVEAAMTLAKLHAQGIAAEPPKLVGSNSTQSLPNFPYAMPVSPASGYPSIVMPIQPTVTAPQPFLGR